MRAAADVGQAHLGQPLTSGTTDDSGTVWATPLAKAPLTPNLLRALAFLPGAADGQQRDHLRLILSGGLSFSRRGTGRSWHISEFFDQSLVQFHAFRYQQLFILCERDEFEHANQIGFPLDQLLHC